MHNARLWRCSKNVKCFPLSIGIKIKQAAEGRKKWNNNWIEKQYDQCVGWMCTKEIMCDWMNKWMNEGVNVWTNEWMSEWNKQMSEWIYQETNKIS